MKKTQRNRWLMLHRMLSAALVLMVGIKAVTAQSAGTVTLSKPDTSQYPIISTNLRVLDSSGHFVKGLQSENLRLMENNLLVAVNSLELEPEGVRFHVAFNEGAALGNRYTEFSRFDMIKISLLNWAKTQTADSPDEFRLFTNQGPLSLDPSSPESWSTALEAYNPDLKKSTPGLSSFTNALDSLLNTGNKDAKATAILFITPLPSTQQFVGIKDIIDRAEDNNIRVFIWLIGSREYASSNNALLLKQYAEQTGGTYFLFTGNEAPPLLTEWLDPMSYVYRLTYKSAINLSGNYPLVLKIQKENLYLESEKVSFNLNIIPPNPIFLSPPAEILRSWTETKKISDSILTPDDVDFHIMTEFPDGLERKLVYSRLFVDNKLADENTAEPFDLFTLDLTPYTSTGTHSLKVIVEDVVGLKGETIETPVEIIVNEQPRTWMQNILSHINTVNGIIGSILLLLVIGGVISIVRLGKRRAKKRKTISTFDPVTEPVNMNGEYTLSPVKMNEPLKWPLIHGVGLAPARLVFKSNGEQAGSPLREIALGNEEITLGSERKKVDIVLNHPTISAVHARICKDMNGDFRVADAGSSAGTWINYAPVSTHGARLEHGDLVQFGRLAYVFELHGARPKRIQVLPYREE